MKEPQWLDTAIATLLRGGVIVSVAVITFGLALTFARHPDYFTSRPALGTLTHRGHVPTSLTAVTSGVRTGNGDAITMAGLLLLICTPVARVALSIVVFAIQRDRLYLAITTAVMIILLISFAIGSAG